MFDFEALKDKDTCRDIKLKERFKWRRSIIQKKRNILNLKKDRKIPWPKEKVNNQLYNTQKTKDWTK